MRSILRLFAATIFLLAASESGHTVVYLNRVLLECDPLTYKIEPLVLTGEGMMLTRGYQNEYGSCVGDPPGPPFVIETGVTIENEYNTDGTVLNWGTLILDNSWGGGDPFVIQILDGAALIVNGNINATGKPGDPVIFAGRGRFASTYQGGTLELQEFDFNLTHCQFINNAHDMLSMRAGHLRLDNCTFIGAENIQGIEFLSVKTGAWNVSISNCSLSGFNCSSGSPPVWFRDIGSIEIHNVHFANCIYDIAGTGLGLINVDGGVVLKDITGLTGSGNSRNWIRLPSSQVYVQDSVRLQTTNDFTIHVPNYLLVDTNAVLFLDKGTVLQMGDAATIHVKGSMIADSAVITSFLDDSYGVLTPGWSTGIPNQAHAWMGIDVYPGACLEVKNNSHLRWTEYPIAGEGNIKVDHSTIEQCWGGINMQATSPSRLEVSGSTISQLYGLGEGISFTLSTNSADSASGRIVIDSSQIIQCGGDGVYIGGGIGRPPDDSLNIRISNSLISGNGSSGIFGYFGPPADSVVIMNNRIIGNAVNGLYLQDGGCDSMDVRLENNLAMANGSSGLNVRTGFVYAIGNTCIYNGQQGLSYAYKPQKTGIVANNILAYNDGWGFYCYAKYGGTIPGLAHNIFWQNGSEEEELYIISDGFTIYTVPELQSLGDVGLTNDEFSPALKADYRDVVRMHSYNETLRRSAIYVDGDSLEAGRLQGLAILPSHRDTTAWSYVLDNTADTIYVAGDISSIVNSHDTLTVFEYHLTPFSPAIEFGDNDYVTAEYDIDGDVRILDSDESGSAIVDAGADEFNPDTTNIAILVFSPPADTTLVPGDTLILSWFTQGIAAVNVDYTIDVPLGGEPVAWLEVGHDLSTLLPLYFWEVPAVQSARCLIRVSDASNPGYSKTSEIFHIKQPRLTRFTADSTYEFFLPSNHGWSFSNTTASLWPQSWWAQYDYLSGQDPYTGQAYPYFDTAYAFGATAPSTFPSWPIFVEAFSQDQCYYNTPRGLMYVMRAVNRWADIGHVHRGSCGGMCSSALLAFGSKGALDAQWGYLGLTDSSFHKPLTGDLREFINILHTHVYGRQQGDWQAQHYEAHVDSTVKLIRQMLLSNSRTGDAFLTMGNQTATSSHAVVPWAVLDDPDSNKVRVYIYDPNDPGTNSLYIEADTVANVWSCSAYPTWGGAWYFFLHYPVSWSLESPDLKALARQHGVLAADAASDSTASLEILFPTDGYLAIHDSAGDSSGINATGGFNAIEGAALIPPMTGSGNTPYGFLMRNQNYDIVISNLKESMVRLGFYYDSLYVGYSRSDVDSLQRDRLRIDGGLTITSPDTASKSVLLSMAITLADGERALVVDSLEIGAGDTLRLEPVDSIGWYLHNPGDARTYRLWMRQVNTSEKEWKFRSHDVPLEAGVAHLLTPDWSNLNEHSCMIYVDHTGNYLADDSIMLYSDIPVGVDDGPDQALPVRFELLQNHPNPFNPVTTIEYSLPTRSHVKIEIFNILGQSVETLVDREESAGSYTITWDGTTTSGRQAATGMYLYRFQAGDHVETKKMVLLK